MIIGNYANDLRFVRISADNRQQTAVCGQTTVHSPQLT